MSCPWWSFEEPIVREVLTVHSALVNDVAGATLDIAAMPARVADGLRLYTIALARSRNERDARKAADVNGGSSDG